MVKHVIFDFDGTLVDSQKVLLSSWNLLAKKHNFKEITWPELEAMKKLSMRERSKRLNFPLYKIPVVAPTLYRLYRDAMHEITLFDGIKDILDEIVNKGYQTSIISSNSKENITQFLDGNKIYGISNVLCSSSIFGKDKLIKRFLKDNKLKSTDVIYVGDEHRDIVACGKTGIKIIWVGWGYDSIEVVEKLNPDYQVFTPNEILQII